jgi:hypothetical protein
LPSVVAIAAIVAGERRSSREREATLKVTEAQHAHEWTLRHGDPYFERRGEVYESLMALVYDSMRRIESRTR